MLTGFFPLAAVLLYIFLDGASMVNPRKHFRSDEYAEEQSERFYTVVPYVCGFCFLLLTTYFIYYYITTVRPYIRDLKERKKLLLHFIPDKTEMRAFNKYYLSTPVIAKRQIQVQGDDFYSIINGDSIIIETLPYSCTILRFTYDGKEIKVP